MKQFKKGLAGIAPGTGIVHPECHDVNLDFARAIRRSQRTFPDGTSDYPYIYNGKTYYMSRDVYDQLDDAAQMSVHLGATLGVILPFWAANGNAYRDPDLYASEWIYPEANVGVPLAVVFAVRLETAEATDAYAAMLKFTAERYSGANPELGIVSYYVVGNEIGQAFMWNNMGPCESLIEYVSRYEKVLRLSDQVVKSTCADIRVYASFDHFWDAQYCEGMELPCDPSWNISFEVVKSMGAQRYKNKEVLVELNRQSKENGDFNWGVVWHAYAYDLFNPEVWLDENVPGFSRDENAAFVTFWNLEVLDDYLCRPEMLYDGRPRPLVLTESGYHADGILQEKLAAASYAFSYYKCLTTQSVAVYNMGRPIDSTDEGGLMLGYAYADGRLKQPEVEVIAAVDTADSFEVTKPYLELIGQRLGKKYNNWSELIPGLEL
jgi:hypothetical protein